MSDEVSAPKKGSLKKWIILSVAALALAGGGFGGWQVYRKKQAAKAAEAEQALTQASPTPETATGEPTSPEAEAGDDCGEAGGGQEGGGHGSGEAAPVMVLTRTVNLMGPRRNAFLRCELNLLFCDTELGKLVSGDKPSPEKSLIQSIVLSALSGKTVEEASDAESRQALLQEIKDKLNEQFKPHPPKVGEKEDPKHRKPKRPIKSVLIVDWAIQQ